MSLLGAQLFTATHVRKKLDFASVDLTAKREDR